ncbi:C13 family peptidase [Sphingomonas sp. SUN039]|uniref:C13 family peptidase n=1 Tax=Sphingomonas sp. SUN039 TaxID=2937787 RepID=UPI002164A1DA|nr:C13 family peptidase [Sphingomonas sp. SUN039]UVO54313.1 C13 family peptidase [Sphingomonas sp. SUN039]
MSFRRFAVLAALALLGAAPAPPPFKPAEHTAAPPFLDKLGPGEIAYAADIGTSIERSRSAKYELAEHRRLAAALARLTPGRKGVVEAFVLSVGLDSDAVFGREAREAGRVLARRYGATGHSLTLAGTDGSGPSMQPMGSPANIAAVLARFAELMGPEDALVLYTTSHGAQFGVVYNDGDAGFGLLGPSKLAGLLNELGIKNRMLLISACYSGVFVPTLVTDSTAIVTAASSTRTSFGCQADNDWTFFGDALINHALRKPQGLATAAAEATMTIAEWEAKGRLLPSQPQSYIGSKAKTWLDVLERALPPATTPVGKPATDALK